MKAGCSCGVSVLMMDRSRGVVDDRVELAQSSPISLMFSLSRARFEACISINWRMKIRVPGSVSS